MADLKVVSFKNKRWQAAWVILSLILFSCQLPSLISSNFSSPPEVTALPSNALPAVVQAVESSTQPVEIIATPYPVPETASVITGTYSTTGPYPYSQPLQTGLPTDLSSAQAAGTPYPGQTLDAYPAADSTGETAESQTQPLASAYPGMTAAQTLENSFNPYPAGVTAAAAISPFAVTQTFAYSQPTFGFTVVPPTFLPTAQMVNTITPALKPSGIPPTLTLTATRTRFLTPTPTLTFTPTPTRTPLPAPPWLNVRITASDPASVVLAAGRPQLIQFFAYWSGPSLAMAPILAGLEKEYAGKVGFVYLDIDNPGTTALQKNLGFTREPHFFLLNGNGQVQSEWIGYATLEQIRKKFAEVLN